MRESVWAKRVRWSGGLLAGLVITGAVCAAPPSPAVPPLAVVDAMQAPAWVQRGAQQLVLTPGLSLQNNDRVVTGPGARAVLSFADGSSVKLGEGAEVRVNALARREDGVFTAALDIARGAFRLTTEIFERYHQRRAINVRVGTMTAGIRGTDLWGRADAQSDFICLLEGQIAVVHASGSLQQLDAVRQCYGAPVGRPPEAVRQAGRVELVQLAITTEAEWENGVFEREGAWSVRLALLDQESAAQTLAERTQQAGFPVRVRPLKLDGRVQYELQVGPLASERDAQLVAARLTQLGLIAPQIVHQAASRGS